MRPKDELLWRVIYIARSMEQAEMVEQLLSEEGFLVRIRTSGRSPSHADGLIELIALEAEAKEARAILQEKGL